ncbi:hypothetical protein BJ878DRAFT_246179 [Calycina marina]|uniref:Vacuolar membrane protein n=1 Tax=Calycina marina TaxID=1763456 RepID=A0A9P7YWW4_9HELO|nr:hypothetical protein BJ878DRAFT_246179 [Calycina marina]
MACCTRRPKMADIRPEQKWDFISLNDFKSGSCLTMFAYGYLWISLLISVAVYGVDTFTAVNLLAFDRWSGEVQPYIPFSTSKWIFSTCIIASWLNLGYEHLRAMRVMKRGAVAESYLDSLAVRLQCIRVFGNGRGWRRFLVFAELTKSKKGAEYVALFSYFSFQSWIRVIFCQGPRQVTNALTLYSVFLANLEPDEATDIGDAFGTFFNNIKILAEKNNQQAVILSGMVFTLIIWVFAALSLILAVIFYLAFLWHYIPNNDGGLSGYCERKINARLAKIVSVKVNKALEEEERKRVKADAKAVKKGEKPVAGRQATIPQLFDPKSDDKLPHMPVLDRNDTLTTLPLYSSRPGTPSSAAPVYELSQFDLKRPAPGRNITNGSIVSNTSFASNAPLMGNSSEMGYARAGSPAPSLRSLNTDFPGPPQRSMTGNSASTNFSRPPMGPPRMPSAIGDRGHTQSPVSYEPANPYGLPSHVRENSVDSYGRPIPRAVGDLRSNTPTVPAPSIGRRTPAPYDNHGRSSPAPSQQQSQHNPGLTSLSNSNFSYSNFPRSVSNATAQPYRIPPQKQQHRNMTDPGMRPQEGDYFNEPPMPAPARSATGSTGRGTPSSERAAITRLASPAPYDNMNGGGSPTSHSGSGGYRQ